MCLCNRIGMCPSPSSYSNRRWRCKIGRPSRSPRFFIWTSTVEDPYVTDEDFMEVFLGGLRQTMNCKKSYSSSSGEILLLCFMSYHLCMWYIVKVHYTWYVLTYRLRKCTDRHVIWRNVVVVFVLIAYNTIDPTILPMS